MDTVTPVILVHAVAALYVLILGPLQILRRRRDGAHRLLGVSWIGAMLVVCLSSYWIGAGFTWLHGLSTWTLVCMVAALAGIRLGNVGVHRGFMVGSYFGTVTAFAFAALVPSRLIPQLLRSEPLVAAVTVVAVGAVVAIFSAAAVRTTARAEETAVRGRRDRLGAE